jgi:hypothetical protein
LSTTLVDNFYDPITVVTGSVRQPRNGIQGAGAVYVEKYKFPTMKVSTNAGMFEYPNASLSSYTKLTPADIPQIGDNFGTDVSINGKGTLIAIGACSGCVYKNYFGFSAGFGKVYVFSSDGSTYTHRAILTTLDKAAGDQFGSSVAIASSANVLVGCSPQAKVNNINTAGACYVFTSSSSNIGSWTQTAKITEPTPGIGNQFGGNNGGVAISGDGRIIVVGAPFSSASGANRPGALYVFRASSTSYTSWSIGKLLRQQTPYTNSMFGYMVTMTNDGTTIAAGAPYDSIGNVVKGSVDVFYTATPLAGSTPNFAWYQKITHSGSSQDQFGSGLALSADGNTLSIGAPGKESVYTYTYNDYDPVSKYTFQGADGALYANNPQSGSQFGYNVKMDSKGFSLFVSAPKDYSQANANFFSPLLPNNPPIRSGALYSFSSGIQPSSISTTSTTSSKSNDSSNAGAIIGGIFGPLFVILIINVCYFMFFDKKKTSEEDQQVVSSVPTAPPPPALQLRTIVPSQEQTAEAAPMQYGIPPQTTRTYGQPNPSSEQPMQQMPYGMQQPQYGLPQQIGYYVVSPTTGQQTMVMMPVMQTGGGGQMMIAEGQQQLQQPPMGYMQQQQTYVQQQPYINAQQQQQGYYQPQQYSNAISQDPQEPATPAMMPPPSQQQQQQQQQQHQQQQQQ